MNYTKLIPKPWGSEELIELNSVYVLKRLKMKKGHRCSLQYHQKKMETIVVISGILGLEMGISLDSLSYSKKQVCESFTLMPGVIHRMSGITDVEYLEVSTPELDDVIRLGDDYGR